MRIVIDNSQRIIALIEFPPLTVSAADEITAQRILKGISVTVQGAETVHFGEDGTIWKRAWAEPGTQRHFNWLGSTTHGRNLLLPAFHIVMPHLIQGPLPTFPIQAIYPDHSTSES